MTWVHKVREQMRGLGIEPTLNDQIDELGIGLTVCQLIVIGISILSVVFLFTPLLYLQELIFLVLFYSLSLGLIILGVWFWINRADICEKPEDFQNI